MKCNKNLKISLTLVPDPQASFSEAMYFAYLFRKFICMSLEGHLLPAASLNPQARRRVHFSKCALGPPSTESPGGISHIKMQKFSLHTDSRIRVRESLILTNCPREFW